MSTTNEIRRDAQELVWVVKVFGERRLRTKYKLI